MIKRSQRLQTVLNVATREADALAHAFSRHQRDVDLATNKLNQLQDYCQDYSTMHKPLAGARLEPTRQLAVRDFFNCLMSAIKLQTEEVARQHELCRVAKEMWISRRQRAMSLATLIAQYQQAELYASNKRDQHGMDELNVQRHVRQQQSPEQMA